MAEIEVEKGKVIRRIGMEEIDEINNKLEFIDGVLETVSLLTSHKLLGELSTTALVRLTEEARTKLEKVHKKLT